IPSTSINTTLPPIKRIVDSQPSDVLDFFTKSQAKTPIMTPAMGRTPFDIPCTHGLSLYALSVVSRRIISNAVGITVAISAFSSPFIPASRYPIYPDNFVLMGLARYLQVQGYRKTHHHPSIYMLLQLPYASMEWQ